jgi:hypothetical protein
MARAGQSRGQSGSRQYWEKRIWSARDSNPLGDFRPLGGRDNSAKLRIASLGVLIVERFLSLSQN